LWNNSEEGRRRVINLQNLTGTSLPSFTKSDGRVKEKRTPGF